MFYTFVLETAMASFWQQEERLSGLLGSPERHIKKRGKCHCQFQIDAVAIFKLSTMFCEWIIRDLESAESGGAMAQWGPGAPGS